MVVTDLQAVHWLFSFCGRTLNSPLNSFLAAFEKLQASSKFAAGRLLVCLLESLVNIYVLRKSLVKKQALVDTVARAFSVCRHVRGYFWDFWVHANRCLPVLFLEGKGTYKQGTIYSKLPFIVIDQKSIST